MIRMSLRLIFTLAAFLAVAAVAAYWQLGMKETSARDAATRFAAALVDNDPGAAPPGAGDYVRGVRAYFGPVRSARLIGDHTRTVRDRFPGVDDRGRRRAFPVVQLMLRTERGPAVIEIEFDDGALLKSEEVSGVYELEPYEAPGLAGDVRLAAAFEARGGRPADRIALSGAGAAAQPAKPAPAGQSPAPTSGASPWLGKAENQLRCIQRAGRDMAKLQECARS
jgi:hypothetical protein